MYSYLGVNNRQKSYNMKKKHRHSIKDTQQMPMCKNLSPERTKTYQKKLEYIQDQTNKIRNLVEDRQSQLE